MSRARIHWADNADGQQPHSDLNESFSYALAEFVSARGDGRWPVFGAEGKRMAVNPARVICITERDE